MRDKNQDTNQDEASNFSSSTSNIEINQSVHQQSTVGQSNVKGQKSNVEADLQSQVGELTADLQRIQADFMNFRRRSDDERGEFLALAKQDVLFQLLPVIDNIGRALGHVPKELTDNPWAKGVNQVAKQADETLKNLGITRIESVGQPFDPHLHEAIGYIDGQASAEESNVSGQMSNVEVVVEELQPGYKLGDKIIRHAMVKVGRK